MIVVSSSSFRLSSLRHLLLFVVTWWIRVDQCEQVSATNERGLAHLKVNREKEGVVELPSGLQYRVLRSGYGSYHPTLDTECSCHYSGMTLNGTEFDSSYSKGSPRSFAPSHVLKSWAEAMQLMVAGDKWELYSPSELAYGPSGSPPKIGPDEALVFIIEMLEVRGQDKVPALICNPVGYLDSCTERQREFVKKIELKFSANVDALRKEKRRLEILCASPMKEELRSWTYQRIYMLRKMIENSDERSEL